MYPLCLLMHSFSSLLCFPFVFLCTLICLTFFCIQFVVSLCMHLVLGIIVSLCVICVFLCPFSFSCLLQMPVYVFLCIFVVYASVLSLSFYGLFFVIVHVSPFLSFNALFLFSHAFFLVCFCLLIHLVCFFLMLFTKKTSPVPFPIFQFFCSSFSSVSVLVLQILLAYFLYNLLILHLLSLLATIQPLAFTQHFLQKLQPFPVLFDV